MLRHSSRIWLLNDSTYPLRYGEPGGMEDRAVRVPAQLDISFADALPGVFVDDRADLDRPILLVGIELEVHRPHHVRRVRCRRVDGRGCDAFASTLLRNAQALVTPEAVDLLAVDAPALGARIVIRPPVPVRRAASPATPDPGPRPCRPCRP